jgi:hypothetical protein
MAKPTILPIPKLEEDPNFKASMTEALKGSPSSPGQFKAFRRQPVQDQSALPEVKSVFDLTEDYKHALEDLAQIRDLLSKLVRSVQVAASISEQLINASKSEAFQRLAASQGCDIEKAEVFLTSLIEASNKVTTK